jgi:hypothetical protein
MWCFDLRQCTTSLGIMHVVYLGTEVAVVLSREEVHTVRTVECGTQIGCGMFSWIVASGFELHLGLEPPEVVVSGWAWSSFGGWVTYSFLIVCMPALGNYASGRGLRWAAPQVLNSLGEVVHTMVTR